MSRTTKWTTLYLCALVVLIVASIVDAGALYFISAFLFMLPVGARVFGAIAVRSVSAMFRAPFPAVVGESVELTLEAVNLGVLPRFNILITADLPPGIRAALPSDGWANRGRLKDTPSLAKPAPSPASLTTPAPPTTAAPLTTPASTPASSTSSGGIPVMVPFISGEGRSLARCRVHTERRGCYPIGPLTLSHQDPFGLMQVRRHLPTTSEIVVYPRPLGISLMPLVGGDLAGAERTARSRGTVDGADFYGVRPYRAGDEWRRIHWRTTARVGQLMVIEREDLATLSLVIVVDMAAQSDDTPSAPLEVLLSLAAQLAEDAVRRMTLVDIFLLRKEGGVSPVVNQCGDWALAMEALARIDPSHETEERPAASLGDLAGASPSIALLTDRLDDRAASVAQVCRETSWPGVVVLLTDGEVQDEAPGPGSGTGGGTAPDASESFAPGPVGGVLPIWELKRIRSADGDTRMSDYHVEPLARL